MKRNLNKMLELVEANSKKTSKSDKKGKNNNKEKNIREPRYVKTKKCEKFMSRSRSRSSKTKKSKNLASTQASSCIKSGK